VFETEVGSDYLGEAGNRSCARIAEYLAEHGVLRSGAAYFLTDPGRSVESYADAI